MNLRSEFFGFHRLGSRGSAIPFTTQGAPTQRPRNVTLSQPTTDTLNVAWELPQEVDTDAPTKGFVIECLNAETLKPLSRVRGQASLVCCFAMLMIAA